MDKEDFFVAMRVLLQNIRKVDEELFNEVLENSANSKDEIEFMKDMI